MRDFQVITNYDSCYFVAEFQGKTYVILEADHISEAENYLRQLPENLQVTGKG